MTPGPSAHGQLERVDRLLLAKSKRIDIFAKSESFRTSSPGVSSEASKASDASKADSSVYDTGCGVQELHPRVRVSLVSNGGISPVS